ncbi:MAG: putative clathrin heavy chain [Streblomastix strix]|uniref:Putative clathrin heavy chain n=1 Tax=Streblomastix strix TaxID=222440 RepID=A0A5J4VSR6_9EUKA|nr:MAG: putative clathrin heavy chain [Streblomastix strix]
MQIYNRENKNTQYVPFYMAAGSRLLMNEVSPIAVGVTALRASADVIYSDPNGFPVAIEYSERYALILLISAMRILSALEIGTAILVVMSKVSTSLIFTSVSEHTEDGLIGVNVQGQVLQIGVDERDIVPYITQKLQNVPLAHRIMEKQLKWQLLQPGEVLITYHTIQRFRTALPTGGRAPPLMQYPAVLLQHRRLNEQESLEQLRPIEPQ